MTKGNTNPETVIVDGVNISCDGGGGVLGHPKVYLTLKGGEVECPYCDRLFLASPNRASHY